MTPWLHYPLAPLRAELAHITQVLDLRTGRETAQLDQLDEGNDGLRIRGQRRDASPFGIIWFFIDHSPASLAGRRPSSLASTHAHRVPLGSRTPPPRSGLVQQAGTAQRGQPSVFGRFFRI